MNEVIEGATRAPAEEIRPAPGYTPKPPCKNCKKAKLTVKFGEDPVEALNEMLESVDQKPEAPAAADPQPAAPPATPPPLEKQVVQPSIIAMLLWKWRAKKARVETIKALMGGAQAEAQEIYKELMWTIEAAGFDTKKELEISEEGVVTYAKKK